MLQIKSLASRSSSSLRQWPKKRDGVRHIFMPRNVPTRIRADYVALPQYPEDTKQTNPFLLNEANKGPVTVGIDADLLYNGFGKRRLDFDGDFDEHEKRIADLSPQSLTFDDVVKPVDSMLHGVNYGMGVAQLLWILKSSDEMDTTQVQIMRAANCARLTPATNDRFVEALRALLERSDDMSEEQLRLVESILDEARECGIDLTTKAADRMRASRVRREELSMTFRANIESAVDKFWTPIRDYGDLDECPKEVRQRALKQSDGGIYIATLQPESYSAMMTYCANRAQRENLWKAFVSRGGFRERDRCNSLLVEELRSLRHQEAKVLGYENFAEMRLSRQMAGSLERVNAVLGSMAMPCRKAAARDLDALQRFASERDADYELQRWDIAYWRRRHRDETIGADEPESERHHLHLPSVFHHLLRHVEQLFALRITKAKERVDWHDDACKYVVQDSESGEELSSFIFDPYRRQGKRRGSYAVSVRDRCSSLRALPMSALLLDFERAEQGLSVADLGKLYRAFGSMLPTLLSRSSYAMLSSELVERDATTTPQAFLRRSLDSAAALQLASSRQSDDDDNSGVEMPADMAARIVAQREHMQSLDIITQLYYSMLDLRLFSRTDFWQPVMSELWSELMPMALDPFDVHPCSLSLLFCEDVDASYYSFIWSEIVAADLHDQCERARSDPEKHRLVRRSARDALFSSSEHQSAVERFRRFRQCDPSADAFLRLSNIE